MKQKIIRLIYVLINIILFVFYMINILSYLRATTFLFFSYPLGLFFILLSIVSLFRLKIKRTLIFGIIGNAFYFLAIFHLINTYFVLIMLYGIFNYSLLFQTVFLVLVLGLNLIIINSARKENKDFSLDDEVTIRKTILDLGTNYSRLEVQEISEVCGFDSDSIISVLERMIDNGEIYAEFFTTTSTVAFNQRANIDEIDKLMATYDEWEEEQREKLENKISEVK